jgi:tyramine---L-glutamate ligase
MKQPEAPMARLKVFAFDYVTEGGPPAGAAPRALPQAYMQHAAMLLDALRADLGALPGVDLCTLAAPGSPGPGGTQPAGSFSERFAACVQAADAVWPLAPESAGVLESLSPSCAASASCWAAHRARYGSRGAS